MPAHSRIYYEKCLELCKKHHWWATYHAILEDGMEGVDWKAMYEGWAKDEAPL